MSGTLAYSSIVLSISVVLNVVLAIRLSNVSRVQPQPTSAIRIGRHLPTLPVIDENGVRRTLASGGCFVSLVYIFSPNCSWCAKHVPVVKQLAAGLQDRAAKIVGVSIAQEGLRQFVTQHRLPFPVYALGDPSLVQTLGLHYTPQIVHVDRNCRVINVWYGAFGAEQANTILSQIDVSR